MNKYIEVYNDYFKTHIYVLHERTETYGSIVGTIIHVIHNEREQWCCIGYNGVFSNLLCKTVTDPKIISMLDKIMVFK